VPLAGQVLIYPGSAAPHVPSSRFDGLILTLSGMKVF
jgi:hypothetical protein